ncbi:MAG TPA: ATP-binding protein, partial [Actinoplanes sp.]|nr:ATP-binding protein [Actinoplanes sp.]
MLIARAAECATIDALIGATGSGRSGAVLLLGAPGAGKSALLGYARQAADGRTVLRATGVPAEQDLPYAGLHELLRPVVHRVDRLPAPQRAALTAALALADGAAGDRFTVSAAVLTLLAEVAGDGGLVCLIDDAHWLDRSTMDALMFAVRRLDAEGVAVILAARPPLHPDVTVPALTLPPLDADAAVELLRGRSGMPVAGAVAATLTAAAEGNPLALGELAGLLTADQLTGRVPLPDPLPIGTGLDRAFRHRIRELPEATRAALLLAAVEGTEITGGAGLDAAEAAGLLRVRDGRLEFRHPLIRSAVYRDATESERRAAHRTMAGRMADPDRRARHLGAAALGPDDAVAGLLADAAHRAARRGAPAEAAAAYRRSAQLTTDRGVRAARLVDSAEEAWRAGQSRAAYAALDEAEPPAGDEPLTDRIAHLRGRFELRRGVVTEAYRILLERGAAAARRDPVRALAMLAEAADAASLAGDIPGIAAAGRAAA